MKTSNKAVTARKPVMRRLLKTLFKNHKAALIVSAVCLIFSGAATVVSNVFLKYLIDSVIVPALSQGFGAVWSKFVGALILMGCIYGTSVLTSFGYSRILAVITQKFLSEIREEAFAKMQTLPIKYFDTHTHGDIMSVYTNDIDAIRQLIGQSLPQVLYVGITVVSLLVIMFIYSIWLTLIVFATVAVMFFVVKIIGGKSAQFFKRQQDSLGKTEGYVEEIIHGQKVVKAFCHEDEAKREFDILNEKLNRDSETANKYANILMPIMNNIGNILYVIVAFAGAILAIFNAPNLTIIGIKTLSVGTVVSFLSMSRMFTSSIGQISQQINAVVMAMAGAGRVYELIDTEPETDDGYVTLVNVEIEADGTLKETDKRTDHWAWRHPHRADGTVTYTQVKGDIQLNEVDFGYEENKLVLKNVSVYAHSGQKVAFVGATGAGKTTITNLINRFYDIADGKIRYDGININKIKKADLRRSLGVVLQDTNLFTGTVMDNIRYGRLDATDEECIAAAKLAGADDFVERLPDGYHTVLTSDGANLSQGQRQLLSIARAAVADAPAMIMDEATSSIDTRTEALVQKGTDRLMEGRTVFVIAHRLSTVRNADVIMVLDHGEIIERGSHAQLIEQKGQYYRLYTGMFELD